MLNYLLFQVVFWSIAWTSDVNLCFPTWNKQLGTHSIDGEYLNTSLQNCLTLCEFNNTCLAVDYNHVENSCWKHTNPSYNLPDNLFDNTDVDQYSINRTCENIKVSIEYCPSTWSFYKDKTSALESFEVYYATLSSCYNYCRFTASCYGFVYNTIEWPICKTFKNANFAKNSNLIVKPFSVLYSFDKDNCLREENEMVYVRCSGQTFPPVEKWCLPGQNVTINKKLFKDQPFCCKEVYIPDLLPLDNNELATLTISQFDRNYNTIIDECVKSQSCALKATNLTVEFNIGRFCSDEKTLNSVAIYFSCAGSHSEPTTSQSKLSSMALPFSSTLFALSAPSTSQDQQSTQESFRPFFSTLHFVPQTDTIFSQDFFPPTPSPSSTASTQLPTVALSSSSSAIQPSLPSIIQTSSPKQSPELSTLKMSFTNSRNSDLTTTFQTSAKTYLTTTLKFHQESTDFSEHQEDKTALVLGALGTTFSVISLLVLLLLFIGFCIMCRDKRLRNVNDVIDKVSWKAIIEGSSLA